MANHYARKPICREYKEYHERARMEARLAEVITNRRNALGNVHPDDRKFLTEVFARVDGGNVGRPVPLPIVPISPLAATVSRPVTSGESSGATPSGSNTGPGTTDQTSEMEI